MVLVRIVNASRLFFFFPYVGSKLFLNLEEISELLDNIDFDLSFVNSNKLFFLFRHRLGRGGGGNCCWFATKHFGEFSPKALYLFANLDCFVNSRLDLHKGSLSLFVKLTAFLDCCNASIGGKE